MGLAMFYEMLSDLQFYEIIKCADYWYMKHYMKIYDNHSGFFFVGMRVLLSSLRIIFYKLIHGVFSGA